MDANVGFADRAGDFSARIDAVDARRQLHLSVGVVSMLAIGIVSAALAVGTHPIPAHRDFASHLPVTTTLHADTAAVGATQL